ncbi:MAG: nickel-dependent hydrogenase large subunit [Chloroflexota bacterium]
MARIVIDPLTRIEGHLKIEAVVEDGVVKETRSSGMLFRGFELILKGREPMDAQQLTQRVCGVCPTSHAMAATLALDSAFGIADKVPENGRILRNLIQGANYIMSHILHFYHLAALDYVDVTKVAQYEGKDPALQSVRDFIKRAMDAGDTAMLGPFVPRYEGDYRLPDDVDISAVSHYVQALNMRRLAHEMSAIFSGKMPHQVGIVPGGVTETPTIDKITEYLWKLQELRHFIDQVYIPDVVAVAEAYSDYFEIGVGCGNLLSYGVFDLDVEETDLAKRNRLFKQGITSATDLTYRAVDAAKITEEVRSSWYSSPSSLHPSQGETEPDPSKPDAYSWLKSPRYDGQVYEAGPLARMAVNYVAGEPTVQQLINDLLASFGATPAALFSVLGRHAARALECKFVADNMAEWLLQLKPGEPIIAEYRIPSEGEGVGLWEAPRGALGHWIKTEEGKIKNYQIITPTSWNASPADDNGQPGPIEQAITGTKIRDEANPFEIVRIVRSFDPCIACAVHLVSPKGTELGKFRVS